MENNKKLITNRHFSFLLLAAFVVGTVLLLVIQINAARNIGGLINGNKALLAELVSSNHLRKIDRDILTIESQIRAAIATGDTSHFDGADEKLRAICLYLDSLERSDSIPQTKIFLGRLKALAIKESETKQHLMWLYNQTGKMDDIGLIANPNARIESNEITNTVEAIYDSRQLVMRQFSQQIGTSGVNARDYGNWLTALILLCTGTFCLYIWRQLKLRGRLIDNLDLSEKKSREALNIKENFLANMSHEIRTPLNSILGFTALAQRQKLDTKSAHYVNCIHIAGENLLAIINDILDIAKIEAGMMRIVNKPFSIREVLYSIEVMFSERVRLKGLGYLTEINEDVPDLLIGDSTRLTQILVNLLGNALKFSERGALRIRVGIKNLNGDEIVIECKVSDNGIGIERKKLDEIFGRFSQADDSITRSYGGTGLGLSIVRDLLALQNGGISVESSPKAGTEFTFFIPYTIAQGEHKQRPPVNIPVQDLVPVKKAHILVVDDNEMNQDLMANILSYWGFTYSVASNGNEAIAILQNETFDLVLMDIQMPEMDGYSTTSYVREVMKSEIPIVAMTAHAMLGEREKCIALGMHDYVSKPIDEHALFALIQKFTSNDV